MLLYDARSIGASDGTPRNTPDVLQMAEDVSGALPEAHLRLLGDWLTTKPR